jgi:DNA-directed RNA polymerase subunit beta'
LDITSGLPRVEELFEARVPKGSALISEIDGVAEIARDGDARRLRIASSEDYKDEYELPKGSKILVKDGDEVQVGDTIATLPKPKKGEEDAEKALVPGDVIARVSGKASVQRGGRLSITYEEHDQREYVVPAAARLRVQDGDKVNAGDALTEGPLNPQDILRIQGPEKVQMYLVEEVQKVYRSQGVTINDKHIEVIVRQMLRRVRVDQQGDTELLPGELVDRFKYETENARVLAEGGEPATAQPVLLGVTKASLNTDSFLAAASFQETTRVLTEAAISGQVDRLLGLKENVIIGKLIPARAPIVVEQPLKVSEIPIPPSLMGEGEEEDFLFESDDEDWNLPEPDEDNDVDDQAEGGLASALDAILSHPAGESEEASDLLAEDAEFEEATPEGADEGEGSGAETNTEQNLGE